MSILNLTLLVMLTLSTGISVYHIVASRKLRPLQQKYELLSSQYLLVSKRAADYFHIIESVLEERNQWKEMWFEGAAGHQEAQFMLEADLQATRYMLHKAIYRLNKQRVKDGLEPMKAPKDLDAPPYGKSKDFVELRKRLEATMAPKTVDWLKKRYHISVEGTDEADGADQQARSGKTPSASEADGSSVDATSSEARS